MKLTGLTFCFLIWYKTVSVNWWSRRPILDLSCSLWIISSAGSPDNASVSCNTDFLDGVAYDNFGGRGVPTQVTNTISGLLFLLGVRPSLMVTHLSHTELPYCFSPWSRSAINVTSFEATDSPASGNQLWMAVSNFNGVADWVSFYTSIHLSRSSSLGRRDCVWYILTDGTPSDGGHNAPFLHGVAMIEFYMVEEFCSCIQLLSLDYFTRR